MKKFLLIVTLFSVICNGCYELDFDTDFHSGIYEKRYSRIYYTTSDNRPIELDTSLENRVVSNTYSNGQGVLVFEDIVTEIESYTFSDCENLTSLKIPDSVTKIGEWAFPGCNRLEKIYISNSVTTIGDSAFKYCSSLTSVYISDLSAWCRISFENYPSNPLYYAKNLYLNNKLVTYLVIPSDITEIKSYAFCKCSCLTSITIPDSVTTIGKYAFEGCSSLTSVYCKATTPPNGGSYMFNGNASGRKIYVPMESVEAYDSAVGWSNYADAILGYDFENGEIEGFMMEYTSTDGNKVTPYSSNAFDAQLIGNYCINGKGYLYFDREITTIGYEAFKNCSNLTSVTIPDSVTTIGQDAFEGCSSLTRVTIPDSVTTIGGFAFFGCSSLTSVTIPDSVTTIGSYAFKDCSSLTSVTIGDSVTTIGDWAFASCSSLTSVHITDLSAWCKIDFSDYLANPLYSAKNLYLNNELVTYLVIPSDITEIKSYAFSGCSSLTSVTIPDSVTTIGEFAFIHCSSLTSITIGDSVTTIGDSAFHNCSSLTSVTIPDSVTTIGDCAFLGCSSLTSITIPDSVTTIGWSAFNGCSSIASITIPNGVTTIGERAFRDCSSLTSITIPDSVTTIGEDAFYNCSSLTSVTIPDSVTTIGDSAFWGCSSLTSVYCKAITPPTVYFDGYGDYWDAFDGNASNRKIYVPMESMEAYKSASGWSDYASDIVGYEF